MSTVTLRRVRRNVATAVAVLLVVAMCVTFSQHGDAIVDYPDSDEVCHGGMEINILPPLPSDDRQMLINLFAYITTPNSRTCRKVAQFGGSPILRLDRTPLLDGHKFACLDEETELLSSSSCLVYSAGISDDWSFDWDMEAFGCTVFAFDPTINVTSGHQNGSIVFLHYGLDQWDHESDEGWQMRTLDTFVQRLGHSSRTIHYLKLDIEDSEWDVLKQQVGRGKDSVLHRNVKQLGVELHFLRHMPFSEHASFYREVYSTFLQLQNLGFYLFHYDPNLTGTTLYEVPGLTMRVPAAVEVVWLKTSCQGQRFTVTPEGGLQPIQLS